MGADVATAPAAVIEQCFKHPLTDIGLERFLKDWEKAQAANGLMTTCRYWTTFSAGPRWAVEKSGCSASATRAS